jgi:UDP-N-acetylmuramoylalanine--D-glutamate ligase
MTTQTMTPPPLGFDTRNDDEWRGKRVTVMGLGLFKGGVAAAEFAARRGAQVTITDLRGADVLAESLEQLRGIDARLVLGRHEESDFRNADLIIANPAVPREAEYLRIAREASVPVTAEIVLFTERCRGRIIAVTGSNGKTTTTSLIGAIMSAHDPRTRLGGNIGRPLLNEADNIESGAPVVLEVSSFQLEWLRERNWSPEIGVITNLSPNHLDRHGTYENYVVAKLALLNNQPADGWAVLNTGDDHLRSIAPDLPGRIAWFSAEPGSKTTPSGPGAWIENGTVMRSTGDSTSPVFPADAIPLLGKHNQENVAAAVAATAFWGEGDGSVPVEVVADAVRSFPGVEHRLELVRTVNGVRWFNDSISTTPESTICALRSFQPGKMILIAGGYDKGIPFAELGKEIADRAAAVVLIGTTAHKISDAAGSHGMPETRVHHAADLESAVGIAAQIAASGQTVALSPACASYDQFRNFAERGESFKRFVNALKST